MFRDLGTRDPETLTLPSLISWVTGELHTLNPYAFVRPRRSDEYGTNLSNNSVRARMIAAGGFLRYCRDMGLNVIDPSADFARLRKSYPRTYGKVQDRNPGRFLTHTQAFGDLIHATHDGTWPGVRDELILRLGLCGLRVSEIANLRWRHLSSDGALTFTGKGNRVRTVVAGPTLHQQLTRWRHQYEAQLQRPLSREDPVICTSRRGKNRPIRWGLPLTPQTAYCIIVRVANRAGLGHVSPHDLRRTAAAILHNTKHEDRHTFDLLDIQRVLGHADPATTMRCYLEPQDTSTLERAAATLD